MIETKLKVSEINQHTCILSKIYFNNIISHDDIPLVNELFILKYNLEQRIIDTSNILNYHIYLPFYYDNKNDIKTIITRLQNDEDLYILFVLNEDIINVKPSPFKISQLNLMHHNGSIKLSGKDAIIKVLTLFLSACNMKNISEKTILDTKEATCLKFNSLPVTLSSVGYYDLAFSLDLPSYVSKLKNPLFWVTIDEDTPQKIYDYYVGNIAHSIHFRNYQFEYNELTNQINIKMKSKNKMWLRDYYPENLLSSSEDPDAETLKILKSKLSTNEIKIPKEIRSLMLNIMPESAYDAQLTAITDELFNTIDNTINTLA